MDATLKRRLTLGFAANLLEKLAFLIIQLVQVSVFLKFWSLQLFGEWIMVNSIPAYLTFSNYGFGEAASNQMTMRVARGDTRGALRVFQSCWWLIVAMCAVVILPLSAALYYLPVAQLLHFSVLGEADSKWIMFYLAISVLFGQLETLLQGAYRCVGRYSFGLFMKNILSLTSYGAMLIPVALGGSPRSASLVFASANLFGTLILSVLVRRDIAWIRFGFQHSNIVEIRALALPALAFMGLPVGTALNLQGTLLAVGYASGPANVVIFGTARTVSRVALQMVQMVNFTFWPEFSMAFGSANEELMRSLHRQACQIALFVAVIVISIVMVIGPWFLTHWTRGEVPPSRGLLALLLLGVAFFAFWSTSSTLLTATSKHQRLAAWYIVVTAACCIASYFGALWLGLIGAAVAVVVCDVLMNFYVMPASLGIARDNCRDFTKSVLQYPPSLGPKALLNSYRRRHALSEK